MSQSSAWLTYIAFISTILSIMSSLCSIIILITAISSPPPNKFRDITKIFIATTAFPLGIVVAAILFTGIGQFGSHPFRCIMDHTTCISTNPLYIGGAIAALCILVLASGGLSSWGMWRLANWLIR